MKTVSTVSRILILSFIVALSAYAAEDKHPQRPSRAELEQRLENLRTACADDIAALCSDAEGPQVIRCLKENSDSLTVATCQQEVAQIPNRPPHHPRPPGGECNQAPEAAE
ncbi:cysteine rich repeat-containing protein [Bdellovibrio sp. HCB337]|uniref:cysteine rich repeat-containing protein n=1 Tax=Bdellovibrio sp. HCB337 TaxID=3394358 RepID=UPI0039A4FFAA